VTGIALFLVGVTANDPECVAIADILRKLNLTVMDGSDAPGTVRAVAALRRIYHGEAAEYQGALLKRVLGLVRELRAAGVSIRGIASQLTADGVQPRGDRWHKTTVERILRTAA
jgi:hypothetical protein